MIIKDFQSIEDSRKVMVPESWSRVRLGNSAVTTIIMGQSPSSSTYNTKANGLPFFQGKTDFGLRNPIPSKWCSEPNRIAEQGDVLVSVRAPVGDANIAKEKCCIGRGIAAIRNSEKTDKGFLFYLFLHHKNDFERLGSGAIFKAINKDVLYDFEVILPPLHEQKAISVTLSNIHDALEIQEKIITTFRELKYSIMGKLFHDGLHGEPLKQTEIGEIPQSWEVIRLGDVSRVRYGLGQPPELSAEGIPMIRATNIKRGRIFNRELLRIKPGAIPVARNPFLKSGDIIVVRSGAYTGDAAVITEDWEGAVAGYDLIVTPSARLNSLFAVNFLLGPIVQSYFRSQRDRSAQPHINSQQLSNTLLVLPPLDEQLEIGCIFNTIDQKIITSERKQNNFKLIFSAMLHLLMTGQVRLTNLISEIKTK